MAGNGVFREKSLERISSPERLDDYIKVSNPSVWTIIFALFILLGGFLYWGFCGSLPTTITGSGVIAYETVKAQNALTCFIAQDDFGKLKAVEQEGKVSISDLAVKVKPRNSSDGKEFSGKITKLGDSAMDESGIAKEVKSDALANLVVPSDGFGVKVIVQVDNATLAKDSVCDVTIVVQEDAPKDFLFS